jgi:hypothetical protein
MSAAGEAGRIRDRLTRAIERLRERVNTRASARIGSTRTKASFDSPLSILAGEISQ